MVARRRSPLVLVLMLAFAATACGGSDAADGQGDGDACVDLTTRGDTFTVRIVDFAFVPSCFTASASQAISIVNADSAEHTFTLEQTPIDVRIPGGETVGGSAPGDDLAPGTYDLVCTLHPEMRGEVTVVE